MRWTVSFYSSKVEQETLDLPAGILANFLRIMELMGEFGPDLGRPHTAPLGRRLFEVRARSREGIARSMFCTVGGREVVVLMTVIKKGSKLHPRQIDIARRRMREVQNP